MIENVDIIRLHENLRIGNLIIVERQRAGTAGGKAMKPTDELPAVPCLAWFAPVSKTDFDVV
jgi:hypothetical protein